MLILELREHNHLEAHSNRLINLGGMKGVIGMKDKHLTADGDQIMLLKEKGNLAKTKTTIENKTSENYQDNIQPK